MLGTSLVAGRHRRRRRPQRRLWPVPSWAGPEHVGDHHRYGWTLAHGPVPPGLVLRHRCNEPLCTAEADLELGTAADNRWDTLARPYRAADLDLRGSAGRSRAIREAVLGVLATGVNDPGAIGAAARAAMLCGDPDRDQLTLWSTDTGQVGLLRSYVGVPSR